MNNSTINRNNEYSYSADIYETVTFEERQMEL